MSVGKFLFSFLLPQKLNRRTNVVLAYNGFGLADSKANTRKNKNEFALFWQARVTCWRDIQQKLN